MSYVVKCDDSILYHEYAEGYELLSTDFRRVDNEPGSFSFTFCSSHPLYNAMIPKKSKIKIYKDGVLKWFGRVTEQRDDIEGNRTVYVVGCLSFLFDSIMRPFEFKGSPEEFFGLVLQQHNEQVSDDQKLYIGNCTVTDPNDLIVRSSIYYLDTMTIVKEKMLNMGGHLVVTFDEDERPILNWYAELINYSTQKVELGSNLVEYEKSLLYDDFYTACIPLGAKSEDTDERLTIKSVNDGLDYIVNFQLAELYGVFYAPVDSTTWDDVTIAANLLVKGNAWLANSGIKYKDVVELSAEDISFLPDVYASSFDFLDNVRFVLASGSAVDYLIVDFSIDILDEYSVYITLSNEDTKYMKSSFTELANKMNESSAEQIRTLEANTVSQGSANTLINRVIEQSTYITQAANEIVLKALQKYSETSDLATAVSELSSQLTQMAGEIEVSFSDIETILNAQGAQGQEFTNTIKTYNSWFRFIAQTATTNAGLVIGQSGNPIQVKIESDVMYFCTDPDNAAATAIAWFSSGALHVNYANVQNLTLGIVGRMIDFRIVGSGDNVCLFISGRLS